MKMDLEQLQRAGIANVNVIAMAGTIRTEDSLETAKRLMTQEQNFVTYQEGH